MSTRHCLATSTWLVLRLDGLPDRQTARLPYWTDYLPELVRLTDWLTELIADFSTSARGNSNNNAQNICIDTKLPTVGEGRGENEEEEEQIDRRKATQACWLASWCPVCWIYVPTQWPTRLAWSGLAWPAPRQSVAKCWCKHHSSVCGQLVYWHENLSKMHHAFIFIIRKHKNNVLDIWPGPNDNVATCCHVFGADYETQLRSSTALAVTLAPAWAWALSVPGRQPAIVFGRITVGMGGGAAGEGGRFA